jgi:hypothetical protein
MRAKRPAAAADPNDSETRLDGFIEKFAPEHQRTIREARKSLQRRFRGAHELVYDNYNFFVIGYSPTERASDAIVSLTAASNGVGLCFVHGAALPDPEGILTGNGKQTRFIRLESAKVLARPEVEALIATAITQARAPLVSGSRSTLVIKSVSAKQRPCRRKK